MTNLQSKLWTYISKRNAPFSVLGKQKKDCLWLQTGWCNWDWKKFIMVSFLHGEWYKIGQHCIQVWEQFRYCINETKQWHSVSLTFGTASKKSLIGGVLQDLNDTCRVALGVPSKWTGTASGHPSGRRKGTTRDFCPHLEQEERDRKRTKSYCFNSSHSVAKTNIWTNV